MKKFIFLMALICCATITSWGQAPPPCGVQLTPPDLATDVSVVPLFTFSIPDSATGFTWVEGDAIGSLTDTIVSQAATGGDTLGFYRNNLTPGITKFWSIIPYNANGDAGTCNIFRFTTQDAPQDVSGATCSGANLLGAFFYEPFSSTVPSGWYGDISSTSAENWDVIQTGGTPSATGPSGAHAGTHYAYFESSVNAARNDSAALFTPPIDLSGSTDNVELELYIHAYGGNMGALNVSATTDTAGGGTWTDIFTLSQSYQGNSAAAWLPVRYNLGTAYNGGNLHLRFTANKLAPADFQSDFAIDEITIKTCQACPAPSDGMASNETSSGADLSWTDNAMAGLAELEIDTAGFTPDGMGTIVVSTNPYTWTGGDPITDYEFYVRSLCAEGTDSSVWVGPFPFTTLCAVISPDYLEDFSTFLPTCWINIDDPGDGGGSWVQDDWINDTGHPNGKSAKINIFLTEKDTLISPDFDLTGGPFQADYNIALTAWNTGTASSFGSDDNCEFLISTDFGVSWTTLVSYAAGTEPTVGQFEIVDLTPYAGMTARFAFSASGGTISDPEDNDLMVDNFQVRIPPACADPSGGMASNVTATTADLSWTDNGGSTTQFIIEIDLAGFTPDGVGAVTSATASYAFTTGTANTMYEFYVTAVCGPDSSNEIGPFAFNTLCATETAPYCQGFELFPDGDIDGATVDCWQNVNSAAPEWRGEAGTTPSGTTGPSGPHAGTRYIFLETSGPAAGATDTITSQTIDITGLSNPALIFWYHMFGSTMGTLHYEASIDGGAWSSLGSIVGQQQASSADPWLQQVVLLSGNTVRIRFVGETGGTFTSDMALDDVCVDEAPTCISPTFSVTPDAASCPAINILVDITALGSATTYNITNSFNASDALGVGVGMHVLLDFDVNIPVDVYIVDAADSSCADTVTIDLLGGCPPSNDECSSAIALTVNPDLSCTAVTAGTTAGATASPQADDVTGTPNNDVWYSFVATDSMHQVSLLNVVNQGGGTSTSTDMGMGLYNGVNGCSNLIFTATSDPDNFLATGLKVDTVYYLRVYGWSSLIQNNNFDVCIGTLPPPPANDDCSAALTLMESDLTCNNAVSGTTVSATASTVADSSCSTTNKDVWYTFTPGSTADYIFRVTETFDFGSSSTYVSVFSGTCGALTQINSSCFSTTTTVALTASTQYYVNVRSTSTTTGVNFDLCAYTCGAVTPDYLESFPVFNGTCWDEATDGTLATGPTGLGGGSWTGDDFGNVVANGKSAKINAFSTHDDWLLSPLFDLSGGGYTLTFDLAATEWNLTTPAVWPVTDTMMLVVSEGGGAWTVMQMWTSSNIPSATGDSITVDLASYTNASTQFAFYYTTGGINSPEDIDVFVDEFEIKAAGGPCGPVTVNGVAASGTYQGTTIMSDATIPSPNMVEFKAVNSIDLLPNFQVNFGATFDATIAPCP